MHAMSSRASMSPSPPPPAPLPSSNISTPSPRYLALQRIFHTALSATLKTNSYPNFAQCFPTPARHCPAALEGVWRQLNAKLEEGCVREFEAVVRERGVEGGLGGWDEAVGGARMRRGRGLEGEEVVRAPHTLSADELHTVYLTPFLQQAMALLEGRLKETQNGNEVVMKRIGEQRVEMEGLLRGLEGVVGDLEGSIEALRKEGEEMGGGGGGGAVEALRGEIWDMEGEMRDVVAGAGAGAGR